jgi:hypothetical protein
MTTPDGFIEIVDEATGKIIATQKRNSIKGARGVVPSSKLRKEEKGPAPHKYILDGKGELVWVPSDVRSDALKAHYPKDKGVWAHVCALVAEGKTLKQVSKKKGMPPLWVLYKWSADPEFKEDWQLARKARAEAAADKIMEIGTQHYIGKDEAAGERVKMDALKFVAETNDRDTYGKQTKVTSTSSVTLILETGVPQIEENPPIEVKGQVVDAEG